jgi:hypothetical protein
MPGSCPSSRTLDPAPRAHYPTLFVSPLSWYTVPDAKVIFCFLPPISPSVSNCCNTLDKDLQVVKFSWKLCTVPSLHVTYCLPLSPLPLPISLQHDPHQSPGHHPVVRLRLN